MVIDLRADGRAPARRKWVVFSNFLVLDDTADNAAQRFISVIDEFYDRGVSVIISVVAAPSELYKDEKLKFEF